MIDTVAKGGALHPPEARRQAVRHQPELLEWLHTGRLTLMDKERQPVDVERWEDLPTEVQSRALAEFERVVRGNAKAAVLFLK